MVVSHVRTAETVCPIALLTAISTYVNPIFKTKLSFSRKSINLAK